MERKNKRYFFGYKKNTKDEVSDLMIKKHLEKGSLFLRVFNPYSPFSSRKTFFIEDELIKKGILDREDIVRSSKQGFLKLLSINSLLTFTFKNKFLKNEILFFSEDIVVEKAKEGIMAKPNLLSMYLSGEVILYFNNIIRIKKNFLKKEISFFENNRVEKKIKKDIIFCLRSNSQPFNNILFFKNNFPEKYFVGILRSVSVRNAVVHSLIRYVGKLNLQWKNSDLNFLYSVNNAIFKYEKDKKRYGGVMEEFLKMLEKSNWNKEHDLYYKILKHYFDEN